MNRLSYTAQPPPISNQALVIPAPKKCSTEVLAKLVEPPAFTNAIPVVQLTTPHPINRQFSDQETVLRSVMPVPPRPLSSAVVAAVKPLTNTSRKRAMDMSLQRIPPVPRGVP